MSGGGTLGLGGQLTETWETDGKPRIPDGVRMTFTGSNLVRFPDDAGPDQGGLFVTLNGHFKVVELRSRATLALAVLMKRGRD